MSQIAKQSNSQTATLRLIFLYLVTFSLCFLGCGQVASTPASQPATQPKVHFYFVQLTDTHLGANDHLERTAEAVREINALPMKVEFVAHTGDIFDQGPKDANLVRKGMAIFKRLKAPIHFVAGNHDVLNEPWPWHASVLQSELKLFEDRVGPLAQKAEYHGVVMLFVCVELPARDIKLEGHDPLAWVEDQLKAAGGKPVIIFIHTPPVPDWMDRNHPGWPKENESKWLDLINRYNVKAVIAGHFHRDEEHRLGHVPLFISAPISSHRILHNEGSFRIYEYTDGKLTYRTQYLHEHPAATATAPATTTAPVAKMN